MDTLMVKVLKVFTFFLIISLLGFGTIYGYSRLVTLIMMPLGVFLSFSVNRFKLRFINNTYCRIFLLVLILGLALLLIARDIDVALISMRKLMGVFFVVIFTVEIMNYRKYDFTNFLLISFVIGFILISLDLIMNFKRDIINISISHRKGDYWELNENTYSYLSYFANICIFYLIQLTRKNIYIILSIFCLTLGVYISFITASRSGFFFTLLIGVIYWMIIFNNSSKRRLFIRLLTLVIIGISLLSLYNHYNDSYLRQRVNQSIEYGDNREILLSEAWDAFADNPFTGLGPGQFRLYSSNGSFSHTSYTEIAANMGIFGLFLILFLFLNPVLQEVKLYKRFKYNELSRLNILAFGSFVFFNGIYVFYQTTYGMIFFFLLLMIQKNNRINYYLYAEKA